jgi:hypothetical protein
MHVDSLLFLLGLVNLFISAKIDSQASMSMFSPSRVIYKFRNLTFCNLAFHDLFFDSRRCFNIKLLQIIIFVYCKKS